jgi:subtilisin
MKRKFSILTIGLVIIGLAPGLMETSLVSQAAPETPKARKIVVFQEETFIDESVKTGLLKRFGAESLKELPLINGVAVLLPPQAEAALAGQAGVLRIDNDDIVYALAKPTCNYNNVCEPELGENPSCTDCKNGDKEEPTPPPEEPAQEMAWGVDRVDADLVWSVNTGQGVKVGIIDTGIDSDHTDLTVYGGYNAVNPRKSWNDDNGHGTHVAGIVAALNNDIGVAGVAPEANLYAIKVLNQRGVGFTSDIIDGLNWAIENGMQVLNMSIGSSGCSQSYCDAIIAAYNAGITIAAAAGNNGETDGSVVCPASLLETIAVSATNESDGLAYFSSYGEEVDLAAPGQDINSTWNDGGYHVGSGTSMATPHVAGTVALILKTNPGSYDLDGDGWDPAEVMQKLYDTAEDIGLAAIYQGAGLVDAESAVTE